MIEILNIFYLIFVFALFSLFGINIFSFFKNKELIIGDVNCLVKNFIIFLSLVWLSSILDFNKSLYFNILFYLSLFLGIFIFYYKSKINYSRINIFLLFFLLILTGLSIVLSHDLFMSHDVRLYWIKKTITFFNGLFVENVKGLKEEYPHYGTYLWGFIWKNSFLNYEYTGRLVYIYIYLISILFSVNIIKKSLNIKYLFFIIIIFLTFDMKYFDGRQDILIFSFSLIMFTIMYNILINKKNINLNYFFLLLIFNLILWTKTEGILYISINSFIILLFAKNKMKYFFCLFTILIIFFKISFYIYHGQPLNPSQDMFDHNTLELIKDINLLNRSFMIIYWYFISLLKNPLLIFGIIFLLVSFIKENKIINKFYYLILSFILINVGIFFTYLITKYDFPFAMIGGLDRVIYQHSGIFLVPLIYQINKSKFLK
jgi:hypothetical protein